MLIDDDDEEEEDLFEEDENVQFVEDLSDTFYHAPIKFYCVDCRTIALIQATGAGRVKYCPVCGVSSEGGDEEDFE